MIPLKRFETLRKSRSFVSRINFAHDLEDDGPMLRHVGSINHILCTLLSP
jgi:hypothetical protein